MTSKPVQHEGKLKRIEGEFERRRAEVDAIFAKAKALRTFREDNAGFLPKPAQPTKPTVLPVPSGLVRGAAATKVGPLTPGEHKAALRADAKATQSASNGAEALVGSLPKLRRKKAKRLKMGPAPLPEEPVASEAPQAAKERLDRHAPGYLKRRRAERLLEERRKRRAQLRRERAQAISSDSSGPMLLQRGGEVDCDLDAECEIDSDDSIELFPTDAVPPAAGAEVGAAPEDPRALEGR